jgi:hypothetical protein
VEGQLNSWDAVCFVTLDLKSLSVVSIVANIGAPLIDRTHAMWAWVQGRCHLCRLQGTAVSHCYSRACHAVLPRARKP